MTDQSPYTTPEAEVATTKFGALTRNMLVPKWIKVFGWIFVVLAALMPILMIFAMATGQPTELSLFGLSYYGPPMSGWALLIAGLYVFLGVSAFGLLIGYDWGLDACIANGLVGAAVCIIVMVMSGFSNIRLELIIQLFYLHRLFAIRPRWRSAPASNQL